MLLLVFLLSAHVHGSNTPADDRLIVRLAVDDLPESLRDQIDSCAIERAGGKRQAVLLLSPREAAGLAVPHEVLGTVADHLRRFAPHNTIRRKAVPSMERHLESPPPRRASGADDCAGLGVSLVPYDEYHNLAEGQCFLQNLAEAYPEITEIRSIGASVEGREIKALRITDQPGRSEAGEQRILFTGVTHAREWITHEIVLYIAEQLTSRYGQDPQITDVVDHAEIWLVPAVNPDGYVYSWDQDRLWRKNRREQGTCHGVDNNRNYDFNWGDHPGSSGSTCSEVYRGPSAASEPETQAIQQLLAGGGFAIGVSYHSYAQLVLFAWGHTEDVTPESYTSLRALGRRYADRVEQRHREIYLPGQSSYTIYLTNGDFDDYAYGVHGVLSFTPEVRPDSFGGGGFVLPESEILPTCEENMDAALMLMQVVAAAAPVERPGGGPLLQEMPGNGGGFSLPVTPVNQKPDAALGFPGQEADQLSTRLDDEEHDPAFEGTWTEDFEGLGCGGGYRADLTAPAVATWAAGLHSYVGLPAVFADGAEVMLSNVQPGVNWIGVPVPAPVRLADVAIFKRRLTGGAAEAILEQRSALQDAASPQPWLDWTWSARDAQGRAVQAHPAGAGGAEQYVLPYRLYEVYSNVPSFSFGSFTEPVYLLRFPPADLDCDDNGAPDAEELAAGAADCNGNQVLDACEIASGAAADCNGNEAPDSCDLADGSSVDCNGDAIPDDCEQQASFQAVSPQFSPLSAGTSHSWVIDPAPAAGGDIALLLSARGDLSAATEHVEIYINDVLAARAFDYPASDCPKSPDVHSLALPASFYNAVLIDGRAEIRLQPSSSVSGTQCADGGWIRVELAYALPDGDCDGNGQLDVCDLGGGAADCDGDGGLDACQLQENYTAESPLLSPLADGLVHVYTIDPAPAAGGEVSLTIAASGDLGGSTEWLAVSLDDQALGQVFQDGGEDCSAELLQAMLTVAPAQFNAAASDGRVAIAVSASPGVDLDFCATSQLRVGLSYAVVSADCNENARLDTCDVASGSSADHNANGVPDECEDFPVLLASDPPDGAIDARQPFEKGGMPFGWDRLVLTFEGDTTALSAADFIVASSGAAPSIAAVIINGPAVMVVLDGPLQPGTCTSILYRLRSQRVNLGFLPADVNGDGLSGPLDILTMVDELNGVLPRPLNPWQCDVNLSGSCEPLDILRVIDLLNGAGSFEPWNGQALPPCPK